MDINQHVKVSGSFIVSLFMKIVEMHSYCLNLFKHGISVRNSF